MNRSSQLIQACNEGNEDRVKFLLDHGANVNARADKKHHSRETALIVACRLEHEQIVELLLSRGADVNAKNVYDQTALMYGCSRGYEGIVERLLRYGASFRVKTKYRPTECVLLTSCRGDKENIVKLLLRHSENDEKCKANWKDAFILSIKREGTAIIKLFLEYNVEVNGYGGEDKGETALTCATKAGMRDVVELLLKRGADVNVKERKQGRTALILACSHPLFKHVCSRMREMAALLLSYGADANAVDSDGMTPMMHQCVVEIYTQTTQLLLGHGANVSGTDKCGKTALIYASQYNKEQFVELLLNANSDVNAQCNGGMSALMYAALNSMKSSVDSLCAAGADINARCSLGNSALTYAAQGYYSHFSTNQLETVESLLKAGADVSARSNDGKSVLLHASESGRRRVVDALLKAGADVNARCDEGKSGAMLAVQRKSVSCLKSLIDAGAILDFVDCEGNTVLNHATTTIDGSDAVCFEFLIKHGAVMDQGRLKSVHVQAFERGTPSYSICRTFIKCGLVGWDWFDCYHTGVNYCTTRCFYSYDSCKLMYSTLKKLVLDALIAGFCPGKITYKSDSTSLLVVSFLEKDMKTFQTLVDRLYYFPEDYKALSTLDRTQLCDEERAALDVLVRQPLSLESWSFLEVSRAISLSGRPGFRHRRVDALPIPIILKRRLKFGHS